MNPVIWPVDSLFNFTGKGPPRTLALIHEIKKLGVEPTGQVELALAPARLEARPQTGLGVGDSGRLARFSPFFSPSVLTPAHLFPVCNRKALLFGNTFCLRVEYRQASVCTLRVLVTQPAGP